MTTMRAGRAVVESLRAEGITEIFGVVGSSYIEVLDVLYDTPDIAFIGARHEQGAAFMALGYARASGRPGVCMATNGPGATNLLTGIAGAFHAPASVVAVTASAMSSQVGRDAFQEIDQVGVFRPITKLALQVTVPERIPDVFRRAFRVATTGRPGPVLVDIPRDLLNMQEVDVAIWPRDTYRPSHRPAPEREAIRVAATLLIEAESPVLVVGAGVIESDCGDQVMALADLIGMPVAASYARGDAIPNDFHLYVGPLGRGGAAEAIECLTRADVILALGTRLAHFTTWLDDRYISAVAKIIQVDVDPEAIGRHYPVAVGILADAQVAATMLLEEVRNDGRPQSEDRRSERITHAEGLRERRQKRLIELLDDQSTPLKPQRVHAALNKVLPRETVVVLDAGANSHYAYDGLAFHNSRTLLSPVYLGCVGSSLPTAIGAKVARPERPVLSINGDGGIFYNLQELETAVRHGIPVVILVMSNNSWGAEKAYQKFLYDERYLAADISNPRFDEVAKLCGARGAYVKNAEDLGDALSDAFASKVPTLIEIPIDPNELPYPARAADVLRDRAVEVKGVG